MIFVLESTVFLYMLKKKIEVWLEIDWWIESDFDLKYMVLIYSIIGG